MDVGKRREIIVFAAISAAVHLVFMLLLPGRFTEPTNAAERTVSVIVNSVRPVTQPKPRIQTPKPPKPPEPKPSTEKTVVRTFVEKRQNQERNRDRKPDAPAPASLPFTAVVSSGLDAGSQNIAVPVGKDTGGTGFTDSKGTSLENRRIETGEAPPSAPRAETPAPQRAVQAPPTPKPDLGAIRIAYAKRVRDRIESKKEYPARARRQGAEGVASVQFTIGHEGSVSAISVARPSGSGLLDNAAMDAVRNAAPFPPLPAELETNDFTLRVSIVFKLDQD